MGKTRYEFTRAVDVGNDVLAVEGVRFQPDGYTVPVRAVGWASAIRNHFGPECYDEATGHRRDEAESREMTFAEVERYCERLLTEQNGVG